MSVPDIFMFSVQSEDFIKIIATVSMSEEDALQEVKSEYSTCNIEPIETIDTMNLREMKEIYSINF